MKGCEKSKVFLNGFKGEIKVKLNEIQRDRLLERKDHNEGKIAKIALAESKITVDPWVTRVCALTVHLYMDSFQ